MCRTSLVMRLPSLALAAALLASSGCIVRLGHWGGSSSELWGQSISEDDGVLTVDGTKLAFNRWVDVSADLASAGTVELGTATEPIRVSGAPGTTATLKVRLYSEIEGDGRAVFEGGRLVARSQGDGKVFINAIEGTVPAGLALNARSGTGLVDVSALAGDELVEVDSGTGDVALRDSSTGEARLHSGTGDVLGQDLKATTLSVDTGTGDVSLHGNTAALLGVHSGTGDAVLTDCHAPKAKLDCGTGDLSLTSCQLDAVEIEAGTGDLLIDGGKFDSVVFDSGTGDLTQRNGAIIGSYTER